MARKDYGREIGDIKDEIASLTDRLKELGAAAGEDIGDTAHEYMDEAEEKIGRTWDKAKKGFHKSRQYVEEHPWQSLLAGAALGFLVAAMIAKKQDH